MLIKMGTFSMCTYQAYLSHMQRKKLFFILNLVLSFSISIGAKALTDNTEGIFLSKSRFHLEIQSNGREKVRVRERERCFQERKQASLKSRVPVHIPA